MRKMFVVLVGLGVLSASAYAWSGAQQRAGVRPASAAAPVDVEAALKALRADLQTSRADIIAKNVTLTSEQAAKFWPVFERYQKEQSAIMDAQLKSVQEYAEKYNSLDDAGALALMKAHLDRDARMVALRQSWLPEFEKVLPGRLAARVLQIDRRVSLAHQIELSSQIPLVY